MMPQLSDAFGLSAAGVASLVGLFYYGYSPFSLVAGVAMDQLGPRKVVPLGAAAVGIGALLFAIGQHEARQRRPLPAGSRRRVRAGRRGLHRDDELPGVARRDADRRDADVRHGRRIGRAVRRRTADRRRRWRGTRSGSSWASPASPSACCSSSSCRRRRRRPGATDWMQAARARARRRLPQSAVDPLRPDRRPALHPDDDLRHGLGRPLPAGSARLRLRDGGAALGDASRSAGSSAVRCSA